MLGAKPRFIRYRPLLVPCFPVPTCSDGPGRAAGVNALPSSDRLRAPFLQFSRPQGINTNHSLGG